MDGQACLQAGLDVLQALKRAARRHVPAVEEGVDPHRHAGARDQVGQRDEMVLVGMHAAGRGEAHQVAGAAALLQGGDQLGQDRVLDQRAVGDGLVDARQVGHGDPAGAEIHVADLGIAHLALGQADEGLRGVDQALRAGRDQPVVVGRARIEDGVVARVGTMSPAIENAQDGGPRTGRGGHQEGAPDGRPIAALDGVELVGAGEVARIGVGILVRHLDGAEHELAARLAVDRDVVGVGAGRIARDDAPRALQHAVLHGLEHARRGLGLVGADLGLGAGDHLLGRLRGRQHFLERHDAVRPAEIHAPAEAGAVEQQRNGVGLVVPLAAVVGGDRHVGDAAHGFDRRLFRRRGLGGDGGGTGRQGKDGEGGQEPPGRKRAWVQCSPGFSSEQRQNRRHFTLAHSRSMVGVSGQKLLRPVDLLGQHRAGQQMRPGHGAERQHECRFFQQGLAMPVGAADQEGHV